MMEVVGGGGLPSGQELTDVPILEIKKKKRHESHSSRVHLFISLFIHRLLHYLLSTYYRGLDMGLQNLGGPSFRKLHHRSCTGINQSHAAKCFLLISQVNFHF